MATHFRTSYGAHAAREPPDRGVPVLTVAVIALVVAVVIALVVVQLVRTPPAPTLHLAVPASSRFPGAAAALPWPGQGQATVSVDGVGVVGSHTAGGGNQKYAIGSVTKIMAAYVLLRDHPLTVGNTGPAITVTPAEVTTYQQDLAAGDSVVAVTAGETITELQALEAALIPSGDNIVAILAQWDAGSVAAFVAKMNAESGVLGLHDTHYADTSGTDPETVSTAADQVQLAGLAMKDPVFAEIVGMSQVTLPVAGQVYNVDADLGTDGIDGVKTGWLSEGGASFVFSATNKIAGHPETVIGAVIGQTGTSPLTTALSGAQHLVTSLDAELHTRQVVASGATVATVHTPTGATVPVVTTAGTSLLGWPGATVREHVELTRTVGASMAKGTPLGDLVVSIGSEQVKVGVVLAGAVSGPSLVWRLARV